MNARPEVVVHIEGRDLPVTVRTITDRAFRLRVFIHPGVTWYRSQAELDELVDEASMVEVLFDESF